MPFRIWSKKKAFKPSLLMTKQHAEEIRVASEKLRRGYMVPLWKEIGSRIDPVDMVAKDLQLRALARDWISADVAYHILADEEKRLIKTQRAVIFLVILSAITITVNEAIMWPITIFFLAIAAQKIFETHARMEDRVNAFHRREALASRIDEACGLDLRGGVSTAKFYLRHSQWLEEPEREFLAETMAWTWAYRMAGSLGFDPFDLCALDGDPVPRYPLPLPDEFL